MTGSLWTTASLTTAICSVATARIELLLPHIRTTTVAAAAASATASCSCSSHSPLTSASTSMLMLVRRRQGRLVLLIASPVKIGVAQIAYRVITLVQGVQSSYCNHMSVAIITMASRA